MEDNYPAAVDKASGIGALEAAVKERFVPTTFAVSLRASHTDWNSITLPISTRKRTLSSQNAELKALEERLMVTEQKLREKQSCLSSTHIQARPGDVPGNLAHEKRQRTSSSTPQLNTSMKRPSPTQPQSLDNTKLTHRTGSIPSALPGSPWSMTGSDYILVEGDHSAERKDKI